MAAVDLVVPNMEQAHCDSSAEANFVGSEYDDVLLDTVSSALDEDSTVSAKVGVAAGRAGHIYWRVEKAVGGLESLPIADSNRGQSHLKLGQRREAQKLALSVRPIVVLEEHRHLQLDIAADGRPGAPGHFVGWACPWIDRCCVVAASVL